MGKDIHNDVWLTPWSPEWPREFHMEKQCIIGALMANGHSAYVRHVDTGYVVIGDFQHFTGYTLFIHKDHGVELFDLEPAVRAKHLEEMTIVAQAVSNAFGAEKMNYECLGNGKGCAHIHWHLFPRKTGDPGECGNKGKGPVWWYPMEKMYADSESPAKRNWKR